jgi:metallophosphoesterase (TIGR00282 family)
MKILFLGDIMGRAGRNAVEAFLPDFRKVNGIDVCIANCENLTDGKGISEKYINQMKSAGIDIFSSGNHFWDKRDAYEYIKQESHIAKPLNYPKEAIGFDYVLFKTETSDIMLITLCGQAFMNPVDSPFFTLENFLITNKELIPKCLIIDFHAESTAEKRTFGFCFDGRISAMLGTHTHVQTADEQILENGTAYITDVGMCGAYRSVIGVTIESCREKVYTNMPIKLNTSDDGMQINGVMLELDTETGKANKIKRIQEILCQTKNS